MPQLTKNQKIDLEIELNVLKIISESANERIEIIKKLLGTQEEKEDSINQIFGKVGQTESAKNISL